VTHYISKSVLKISVLVTTLIFSVSCVYKMDIQQGNLLDESNVEQVVVGMTRTQVRFLLGTPMISDSFHQNRWDYTYYFQSGRSNEINRRWFIVFFQDDEVTRIERNAILTPTSGA
jgi:outer membrane protein assembly factor BamE